MSAALNDLLAYMREHPAFKELLDASNPKPLTLYSPASQKDAATQTADYVFGSGMHRQHMIWREFLIHAVSPTGESQPSHQEKS
jgi:hypothetical protein